MAFYNVVLQSIAAVPQPTIHCPEWRQEDGSRQALLSRGTAGSLPLCISTSFTENVLKTVYSVQCDGAQSVWLTLTHRHSV